MDDSSPSSESNSWPADQPSTPTRHTILAELSPPNSRGPSGTATTLPTLSNISNSSARRVDLDPSNSKNANGKRVLQPTDEHMPGSSSAGVGSAGALEIQNTTEEREQPPGWGWQNKKAREEAARALDNIVQKDLMVKTRYGDPLLES